MFIIIIVDIISAIGVTVSIAIVIVTIAVPYGLYQALSWPVSHIIDDNMMSR